MQLLGFMVLTFSEKEGRIIHYSIPEILEIFVRISPSFGLSHANQQGSSGHAGNDLLTEWKGSGLAGFKNTISIDQVMARKRFPPDSHPLILELEEVDIDYGALSIDSLSGFS